MTRTRSNIGIWLATPLLALGCGKPASQPPNTGVATVPAAKPGEKSTPTRSGGIFSVRDETKNRLLLRDIGLSCQVEDVGRLPKTLDELKAILKGSKSLAPVESGEFVLVPNAQVSGHALFVYERDADANGNRLVLMGDGSVHKKSAAEFVALKKE